MTSLLFKIIQEKEEVAVPMTIFFGFVEGADFFFVVRMYSPFPLSTTGASYVRGGCEARISSIIGSTGSIAKV